MAGSNRSTHSQASTPTTRQTTTTPSTRSTQASTAPPTTPSPPPLRRRRGALNLTPSPPLSEASTAWEPSPTASSPLADLARTSQHWEHSPSTTGPLADFARSGLYPPPPHPPPRRPLPPPPRFPRRYNDVTDPSARPAPAAVPLRRPIDAAAQLRSAERRYPETARRPTAMDQAQAEVQRMLDGRAGSGTRYAELPRMEGPGVAGLRVRGPERHLRNPRVEMARVPDLGVLGTIMPFPEVEVRRRGDGVEGLVEAMAGLSICDEEEDDDDGVTAERSVLDLSEEDQMRLEDELAEMMAEGSSDGDGDTSMEYYDLDGAAESSAMMAGRRSSVDSWGLRRSIVDELADASRAGSGSQDSMENEYVPLPPPFPFPENLPMYVQALQKAGLEDLDDLPELVMQNFMRQARERDGERNRRIKAIQQSREEISEKIRQRPGHRMRHSSDAEAFYLLKYEIDLLWHYDAHHWPTLEPLDYELDDFPWGCEVPSVPCWLDEPHNWNPGFSWDAPFSARRRSTGALSLISGAQDRPMSPSSTDFGFVRAAIKAIEEVFQR
ncbi:hypothetical protein GTA08_BOTSDO09666 [Neofusicoccum parvum]|nr:hypothetical protein GTA08_BOTSDO09666 [Neofusicoccum parvum]